MKNPALTHSKNAPAFAGASTLKMFIHPNNFDVSYCANQVHKHHDGSTELYENMRHQVGVVKQLEEEFVSEGLANIGDL